MTIAGEQDPVGTGVDWRWLVVLGVASAVLGIVALSNAVDATVVTAIVVGYALAAAGVLQLVGAFTSRASGGWRALHGLLGVLYLLVGLDLVLDPLAGVIALTIVVAILLVIEGVARLWLALRERGDGWGIDIAVGVVDVLLGLWLWTGIPYTGVAIGIFVGLQLVLAGLSWIVLGVSARSVGHQATSETM